MACGDDVTAGLVVLVLVLALVALFAAVPQARSCVSEHVLVLQYVDSSKLKVVWSTLQIVSSIPWALEIVFPEPFNRWVGERAGGQQRENGRKVQGSTARLKPAGPGRASVFLVRLSL